MHLIYTEPLRHEYVLADHIVQIALWMTTINKIRKGKRGEKNPRDTDETQMHFKMVAHLIFYIDISNKELLL